MPSRDAAGAHAGLLEAWRPSGNALYRIGERLRGLLYHEGQQLEGHQFSTKTKQLLWGTAGGDPHPEVTGVRSSLP